MRAGAYVSFELRGCFGCLYFLLLSMDVFYKTILKLHIEVAAFRKKTILFHRLVN
jgi:hypothetical protein